MKFIEKIFIFLAVVPFVGIVLFPQDYRLIGDIGWYLLLAILAVHPLVNIFPSVIFFKKLMPLRKSAGILCGSLLFFHTLSYFISTTGLSWSSLLLPWIWDPYRYFFYGVIGIIIIILLTLTSNLWSIIHLKKWWKRLHYFAYVAFVMGAIHQIMIVLETENGEWNSYMLTTIIPIIVLLFLRLLSFIKKHAVHSN